MNTTPLIACCFAGAPQSSCNVDVSALAAVLRLNCNLHSPSKEPQCGNKVSQTLKGSA